MWSRWTLGRCAHCDAPLPLEGRASLWCSRPCQQYAKDLRWLRRRLRDGSALFDPDVRHAVAQRLAWLPAGGYPADRRVPDRLRREVLAADGGRCAECGTAPATEVDHVAGGSDERDNLRGLCGPCHRARSDAALVPAGAESRAVQQAFLLLARLPPARLAHDERHWDARRHELLRRTQEWQVMARAYGALRPAVTVWGPVDWGDDDG